MIQPQKILFGDCGTGFTQQESKTQKIIKRYPENIRCFADWITGRQGGAGSEVQGYALRRPWGF
jgi:hypothetical protein